MRRRRGGLARGAAVTAAAFAALIAAGCALFDAISGASGAAETQRVRQAARAAALTCYAVEGAYPSSVEELVERYGLRYNSERYIVAYDAFAENVMPEIRVLERGAGA